ncbi:hypothetical protein Glove_116g10 [Diversispora epigaea]|uniref:Uncharacterized protein n=1 Tax=Diversispora epigaea TaxID=1348612 RepID=A0A397J4N4_9GLOM|nr:hypothetical protein Glove_116g10 [Diversispora epigaea]
MRNRSIFTSAIAGLPAFTAPSTSSTSRRTRPGTEPTAPFVVEEEEEREAIRKEINVSESSMKRLIAKIDSLNKKMDTFLKEQIDIKKRLKNIELLSEINNDPDFSKVIARKTSWNRAGIASRVKSAIFEIFGESQLPRIDFQSSSAEINSWKSDQRVKDAYRKLFEVFSDNCIYMEIILDRIWRSKKKISNMYIVWGVAIAQLFLNPKRKLQKKLPLKPGDGELEAKPTTEEESEEWEEEKRSSKRRRTSGGRILSPRLGSPWLGSSRLGSPWLGSPRLASS